MKFLRKIKEVTWEDQIRNEVIRNELQVEPLEENKKNINGNGWHHILRG